MSFASEDRVSRRRPCPICKKTDWCLLPHDRPDIVICMRIESPVKAGRINGWIHKLGEPLDAVCVVKDIRRKPRTPRGHERHDWPELAARFQHQLGNLRAQRLADILAVSPGALDDLGFGFCPAIQAWTCPMYDAAEAVIGVQLRFEGGAKRCIKGSRLGLFIPEFLMDGRYDKAQVFRADDPLLICEGASDTVAVLDLGFDAIGRPSASVGVKLVRDWLKGRPRRSVVVVGDNDATGRRGADSLARAIRPVCRDLRLIVPFKGKDFRSWCPSADTLRAVLKNAG